jgi:broad specificity phosphatase PhoE
VWLVRHAETEWSLSGKHTGRTDVPLTDAGRERARVLGERLRDRSFALVLVSPLERAQETARLAGLGDSFQVREDLLEWDYGEYEGITTREIREARPDWYLWTDGVPGGETAEEVGARCDRIVEEILGVDGDVAIFAHGHVLRALGARWVEEPVSFGGRLYLTTGSLSTLGFEREVRVIRLWNEA